MWCVICGEARARVRGRCRACYMYLWRTGRERHDYLVQRDCRREEVLDAIVARLSRRACK